MDKRMVKCQLAEFEVLENGQPDLTKSPKFGPMQEVQIQFKKFENGCKYASLDSIWMQTRDIFPDNLRSDTIHLEQPREDCLDMWVIGMVWDTYPIIIVYLDEASLESDFD